MCVFVCVLRNFYSSKFPYKSQFFPLLVFSYPFHWCLLWRCCMKLCLSMHAYEGTSGDQRLILGISSGSLSFWDRVSHWTQTLLIQLGWLISALQRTTHLLLPPLGWQVCAAVPDFRLLCLCSKHFTRWAIFPALVLLTSFLPVLFSVLFLPWVHWELFWFPSM